MACFSRARFPFARGVVSHGLNELDGIHFGIRLTVMECTLGTQSGAERFMEYIQVICLASNTFLTNLMFP